MFWPHRIDIIDIFKVQAYIRINAKYTWHILWRILVTIKFFLFEFDEISLIYIDRSIEQLSCLIQQCSLCIEHQMSIFRVWLIWICQNAMYDTIGLTMTNLNPYLEILGTIQDKQLQIIDFCFFFYLVS